MPDALTKLHQGTSTSRNQRGFCHHVKRPDGTHIVTVVEQRHLQIRDRHRTNAVANRLLRVRVFQSSLPTTAITVTATGARESLTPGTTLFATSTLNAMQTEFQKWEEHRRRATTVDSFRPEPARATHATKPVQSSFNRYRHITAIRLRNKWLQSVTSHPVPVHEQEAPHLVSKTVMEPSTPASLLCQPSCLQNSRCLSATAALQSAGELPHTRAFCPLHRTLFGMKDTGLLRVTYHLIS